MHETLSNNFLGNIDSISLNTSELNITGWVTSTHPVDNIIYFLDIGYNKIIQISNERLDVFAFYNNEDIKYRFSGFDIKISPPEVPTAKIFAFVNGKKELIFEFNLISSFTNDNKFQSFNGISSHLKNSFIVIDNFYKNPDEIRTLALQQEFENDIRYFKGKRTNKRFIAEGTKDIFEKLLNNKISGWENYEYNGIFQYCTAEDPLVYHCDTQSYAAAIYLTPDAPIETGTTFYRSKKYPTVRKTDIEAPNYNDIFKGGYYDKTNFEVIDIVGNVYNRLVIWDAKLIHSASQYFGTDKYNSRLFHLFFFDIEE